NLLHIESPHLPDFFKEGGGFNVGLTYVFVYDSYRKNDDLNDRDDIFGLDISLPTLEVPFLRRGIGRKLEITISDDFHPEEYSNIAINNREDRTLRFTNDFSTVLVYPVNRKTFLALPYLNQFIRYKDSELKDFNSMSHTFAPTISYYMTEKTSFFVGGRYGIYQFEDDANNFKTFTLQAGIFKVLTPKVNLGFSGGYQVRTFKRNNPSLDKNDETSDDSLGSFVFDFFYNQRISRKTNFRFSAGSGITDTLSTIGSLSSSRTLQENIDQGNPSVIQGTLRAELTHALTEKISLYGRGEAITEKQENPDNTNVLYTFDSGLTYRLRYNLSLNFNYRYSIRNSDNSDNNFGDNLFTISLDYGIGGGEGLINIRRGGKALANA
ncbi:MAG TPA: outer membrane beta-barrel protein, partial [bacterium]|nr:outer membrane beta-barrel protein [bacterium]